MGDIHDRSRLGQDLNAAWHDWDRRDQVTDIRKNHMKDVRFTHEHRLRTKLHLFSDTFNQNSTSFFCCTSQARTKILQVIKCTLRSSCMKTALQTQILSDLLLCQSLSRRMAGAPPCLRSYINLLQKAAGPSPSQASIRAPH